MGTIPSGHGVARSVDVRHEQIRCAHALNQPRFDRLPIGGVDHPRQQVERKRLLTTSMGERDAVVGVVAVDLRRTWLRAMVEHLVEVPGGAISTEHCLLLSWLTATIGAP